MLLTGDPLEPVIAAQSDRLAECVEAAFPTLALGKRRLDQSGGDHVLLIVDEHFAFRFPRSGTHGLNLEIAVLERLRRHSPVATPSYQYVDPRGRFAGYPFIRGSALTPARYDKLTDRLKDDVLQTTALFLTELHGLAAEAMAPLETWPLAWAATDYADRGIADHLSNVAKQMPMQAHSIEQFYNGYREVVPPHRVVIHGDLVVEHLLLNDKTEQLSGIIDFGDVALGDPAQDFLGFWAYGADAVARAVELYRPAQPDPTLLARSREHATRYRLDAMLESMTTSGEVRNSMAAEIDALLAV